MKLLSIFTILLLFPVLLQAEDIIKGSKISGNPLIDESNLPISALEIKVVDCAPMGEDGCFDWCVLEFSEVRNADKIYFLAKDDSGITYYELEPDSLVKYIQHPIDKNLIDYDIQQSAKNSYGWIKGRWYNWYDMLCQYTLATNININNQCFIISSYIKDQLCLGNHCMEGDIIRIFSLDGRKLIHIFFKGQNSLDLSSYPEGIYILNIQRNDAQLFRSKIVLKH